MEKRHFVVCLVLAFVLLFYTLPSVEAATTTFTFENSSFNNIITNESIYWGTSASSVTNYLGTTNSSGQIIVENFSQTGTIYFKTGDGTCSGSATISSSTTSVTVPMYRQIAFTFKDSGNNCIASKSIYWGTSSGTVANSLGTTDSHGQITTTFTQTGTIYFKASDGTCSGSATISSSTTSKTVYMAGSVSVVVVLVLLIVVGIVGSTIIYAATREKRPPAPRPKPTPPPAALKPLPATPEKRIFVKLTPKRIERKPALEQIESKVYKHIKRHRGALDVAKCAKRLGVSEEEVERASKTLVAKGKLKKE